MSFLFTGRLIENRSRLLFRETVKFSCQWGFYKKWIITFYFQPLEVTRVFWQSDVFIDSSWMVVCPCVFPHIRVFLWWRQPRSCSALLSVTVNAVWILTIFMFFYNTTYITPQLGAVWQMPHRLSVLTFWQKKFSYTRDISPFSLPWFAKDVSHAMQFFFVVTATSHCCWGCRDHVAPVIHVEPPAASSPASRKLHQEGMRFTLSPSSLLQSTVGVFLLHCQGHSPSLASHDNCF